MGFGAVITDAKGNILESIAARAIEARIEQTLSKPTKFAIRLEADLCDGELEVADDETALQPDKVIGIFVMIDERFHCLVLGPITQVRTAATLGGSGSWIEVRGEDQRIVMNRVGVQATWTVRASAAATAILDDYGFKNHVDPTTKNYPDERHALNQRATDLAFLEDIARRNVFELWLEYTITESPDGKQVVATPDVQLKASPPLQAAAVPAPPILSAAKGCVIDVNPPADRCVGVTRFDAKVDYDRPNAVRGFAQASASGDQVTNSATPTQPPLTPGVTALHNIGSVVRRPLDDPNPDPEDQHLAQQAMLTEAAWFVEVDCSTTLEMLGFYLSPHLIVQVQSAGPRLSGAYQVKTATHVINAADHYIDFKLRANGLREKQAA